MMISWHYTASQICLDVDMTESKQSLLNARPVLPNLTLPFIFIKLFLPVSFPSRKGSPQWKEGPIWLFWRIHLPRPWPAHVPRPWWGHRLTHSFSTISWRPWGQGLCHSEEKSAPCQVGAAGVNSPSPKREDAMQEEVELSKELTV